MKRASHQIGILLFIALQLCCGYTLLFAQGPTWSKGGRFRVDYVKGCAPFTVKVVDTTPDGLGENAVRHYILHDDKGNEIGEWTNSGIISINNPGTYYLLQDLQNRDDDSVKIVAISPKPAPFSLTNCGNRTAAVEFIPEEGTYTEFLVLIRRPNQNADEATPFTVEKNGQGQFKGEIPFQGTGEYDITIKGLITEPDPGSTFTSCRDTTFRFTILEELAPPVLNHLQAQITPEEDTAILSHELLNGAAYILEYAANGSESYQAVQEIRGPQTNPSSFISFDFEKNFYCFQGKTRNPCNETDSRYSETICTARLQLSPLAGGNQVNFETAPGPQLQEASLLRKTATEANWEKIHSFGASSRGNYLDSLIDCSTSYQYAIELSYANGSRSITQGQPVQNEAGRELPAPANIVSSWPNASKVDFTIAELINKKDVRLQAFRASENRKVDEVDTGFIRLPAAGANSCYRFQYTDACGNVSGLSEAVCAIFLQNVSTEPDGLILQWNAYTGYAAGVDRYELVKYDRNGSPQGRTTLGTETTLDLGTQELSESGMFYEVIAYPGDLAVPPSSSNRLLFEITMKGYFPNAFNPQGEGPNSKFTVLGKFVEQLHLQVFNRWGEQVFETKDKEAGWDGRIKGEPAPSGTYVYKAVIGTADGQQQTYQGAVFLMRR